MIKDIFTKADGVITEKILPILNLLSEKHWLPFFILLLVLFTGMRLVKINADAPPELSISAAIYTDEGLKTITAKNLVQFGAKKWTNEDRYKSWYKLSPLPTYLYGKWFRWFGAGFASIRCLNIIISAITMSLLFFFVRRRYDNATAFISFFIFGISQFTAMYQRLGFYENFLVLFLMIICFALYDFYNRVITAKKAFCGGGRIPAKEICIILIDLVLGGAAALCCMYTKQSVILVLMSLIPFVHLYFLHSHRRLNGHVIRNFYFLIVLIGAIYFLLAHFEGIHQFLLSLLQTKVHNVRLRYFLPLKMATDNFDPFYLMIPKSLLMEFAYLQPVIFFSAVFFALYVFHNFLYKKVLHLSDLFFSSWFLFGFLFLTLLNYHPSRYYLLISIPLVILAARFFTCKEREDLAQLLIQKKSFSFRRVVALWLKFYFIYNIGVSLFMLLPLQFKKGIYDDLLVKFIEHRVPDAIPALSFLAGCQIVVFTVALILMRNLYRAMSSRSFYTAMFVLMIILQTFQYGKWLLFSKPSQYLLSKKIGAELPPNAIIAGGWAPGLNMENTLRSIVIQGDLKYNRKLIAKIIANEAIKTKVLPARAIKPRKVLEQDIPLYMAVAKNSNFEWAIWKRYAKYLTDENIAYTQQLGYFDLVIYRLKPKEQPK